MHTAPRSSAGRRQQPPQHSVAAAVRGEAPSLSDQREDFLKKMRQRAELSSAHGGIISQLSALVLTNQQAVSTRRRTQEHGDSDDDSDEDSCESVSVTSQKGATPRAGGILPLNAKHAHAVDEERAMRLQAELAARIRAAQANAAHFAKNSVVTRLLPVDKVELTAKPDCIHGLTSGGGGKSHSTALYEEPLSFWGVWFAVHAAVRFQRPLRRKRVIDVELARVKQKEDQRRQVDQLKSAGLAHDTRRTARQLLRHAVARSETNILLQSARGTVDSGTNRIEQRLEASSARLPQRDHVGSSNAATTSLHKLLMPRLDSPRGSIREDTRTYDEKTRERDVRKTAERLAQGKGVCSGLAKTLVQRTHTAEPAVLAELMLKTISKTTMKRVVGENNIVEAEEKQQDLTCTTSALPRPPVRPLVTKDLSALRGEDASSGTVTPYAPLTSTLSQRYPRGAQLRDTSSTTATPKRSPRSQPESRSPKQSDVVVAQQTSIGSASYVASGQFRPAKIGSITVNNDSVSLIADDIPSIVAMYSETQRRNAISGFVAPKAAAITFNESDFNDVPLPKLNSNSARAYPPPAQRPHAPRRNPKSTDVELAFLRRVDTNSFHQDVCERLAHAEDYRQRDFELKRQFLQHFAHGNDPGLTVHTLVRELTNYVDAKRKQDARVERHHQRIQWFHRFYEAMMEKCSWSELESLFLVMEKQIMNEFSSLQSEDFHSLFQSAAAMEEDHLSLPSVQFFLCHVAVAYGVPYIEFRELFELHRTPYVLQGNGERFMYSSITGGGGGGDGAEA